MHWVLQATGSSSYTKNPLTGQPALRANPTAQAGGAVYGAKHDTLPTSNVNVVRAYVYFATLPNVDTPIATFIYTSDRGIFFQASDSKLYVGDQFGSYGATGYPVVTGKLYQLDLAIDASANPWTIDGRVNGVVLGQKTHAAAAATSTELDLDVGNDVASITADVYWGDVVVTQTLSQYPIGPGFVRSFVPNRDSNHTCTGTNIVDGTTGTPVGTGITAARLDVHNWLNGRPIGGGASDATRLVNQQSIAALEYIEVLFEDQLGNIAPHAVEVLVVDQQAATTVGTSSIKMNDNGLLDTILARSGAGVVTDRYTTKQYHDKFDGGPWTLLRFNNLKARFGFSDDATPDQYFRGVMIEAAFPSVPSTIYRRLPPTQRMYSDG